jgi:hypothetical protein
MLFTLKHPLLTAALIGSGVIVAAPLLSAADRTSWSPIVNRLLMFVGMTVGGYVGWWAGEYVGFDLMGTFLVSSLGSLVGIYAVWRIMRDYLS